MDNLIFQLSKDLDTSKEYGILFDDKKVLTINPESYKLIIPKTNKNLVFIDGGNQELIGTSTLSLQLIKIAQITYNNNKKISQKLIKQYCLAKYAIIEQKQVIILTFFNEKYEKLEEIFINPLDPELVAKNKKLSPSQACEVVRRLKEIETCVNTIGKDGLIVLDGSFESSNNKEKNLIQNLIIQANKKNASLIALSKTNSLITLSGKSVDETLEQKGPQNKAWYYTLMDNNELQISVTKLHPKAAYCFKTDIIAGDTEEILSNLAHNSTDPVFYGYPYGLIAADNLARVTNNEIESEKTRLQTFLGKEQKNHITKKPHAILDKIRF